MSSSPRDTIAHGYELEGVLTTTDHSVILAARQQATGRMVALKVARDAPGADALRTEICALARIRHFHLVAPIDHGDRDGSAPWLALPLARASLVDLCAEREGLPPDEVAGVAVAIAHALAALHRHGIVHGDVTPANILLAPDGRPLLCDLGAARPIGSRPKRGNDRYHTGDGVEADIAALASSARDALSSADATGSLGRVLDEFSLAGDRAERFVDAVLATCALPRWPVAHTVPRAADVPRTREFGPRPPKPVEPPARSSTRNVRRAVACVVAVTMTLAGAHLIREWIQSASPPPASGVGAATGRSG